MSDNIIKKETSNQNQTKTWLGLGEGIMSVWYGKVIIGLGVLLLANQTFGDPMGKYMDHRFEIESQQTENTYNLQLKTQDFLENDVMDRLDDIYIRLDNVENDLQSISSRVDDHDRRLDEVESLVNN